MTIGWTLSCLLALKRREFFIVFDLRGLHCLREVVFESFMGWNGWNGVDGCFSYYRFYPEIFVWFILGLGSMK
jgi:hypothetical protein